MAEKTNKRKVAKAVTAVGMAAVLLMGGTFAWQSISQEATNIVSAAVNPGGRLHDDFDGSNDKNIYVENFGTQNIYARIKLSEYLEIGQDAGNFAEDSNRENNLANGDIKVLLGEDIDTKATYTTYKYGETNTSDEYWTKDWDGSTKYIPTFNKDQDSLEADLNGTYEYVNDAGENVPYGDFVDYNADDTYSETAYEWFDADTNDTPEEHENPTSIDEGNHSISETEVEHTLADSLEGTVISMSDWDGTAGAYWVYDTDGWAYWAQAIEPETATGLLLDSITDLGLIDEDYYYAIHVTGQFITAGDLGDTDGTGFYQNAGEEPTAEALELLKEIGVKVDGEEDPGETYQELVLDADNSNTVYAVIDEGIKITTEDETADLSSVQVYYWVSEAEGEATEAYLTEEQYTYADGILTITDSSLETTTSLLTVTDSTAVVSGSIKIDYSHDVENADRISIGYVPKQDGFDGTDTAYGLEGYMKPGDYMQLTASAEVDGVVDHDVIVSEEDVWTVSGATSSSTTVDENGKLTIGGDESTELHLITVKVEYRGLEAEEYFYVSGGLTPTITEVNNTETYITNTNYQFTVSVVENEKDITDKFTNWDWSVTEKAEDGYGYSTDKADIDENGNFKATAAGTYFISANADNYYGPNLEITVK